MNLPFDKHSRKRLSAEKSFYNQKHHLNHLEHILKEFDFFYMSLPTVICWQTQLFQPELKFSEHLERL